LFLFAIRSVSFICYTKLENLLDTFYSLNANRNAQSAGNLPLTFFASACLKEENLGSSETIRGNTYDLFKLNFRTFFNEEFKQDNS
jgi:hypothetical protein